MSFVDSDSRLRSTQDRPAARILYRLGRKFVTQIIYKIRNEAQRINYGHYGSSVKSEGTARMSQDTHPNESRRHKMFTATAVAAAPPPWYPVSTVSPSSPEPTFVRSRLQSASRVNSKSDPAPLGTVSSAWQASHSLPSVCFVHAHSDRCYLGAAGLPGGQASVSV